jgi:hypothetical protein
VDRRAAADFPAQVSCVIVMLADNDESGVIDEFFGVICKIRIAEFAILARMPALLS